MPTLDEQIAALAPVVDTTLRQTLQEAVDILRRLQSPGQALLSAATALEGEARLLGLIAAYAKAPLTKSVLEGQIEELRKAGHLPGQLASDFHWVRVYGNKVRHSSADPGLEITVEDAQTALRLVLRGVCWLYCHWEKGPRLPAIFTLRSDGPRTDPADPLGPYPRRWPAGRPRPDVPGDLIEAYAEHAFNPAVALAAVREAGRLRRAADPDATVVKAIHLPTSGTAFDFWATAFEQALLHSPRMVAALVLTIRVQ